MYLSRSSADIDPGTMADFFPEMSQLIGDAPVAKGTKGKETKCTVCFMIRTDPRQQSQTWYKTVH